MKFIKKLLSILQNNLLTLIYKIKPKFFYYQSYSLFNNYLAIPKITGLQLTRDTSIGNEGDIIYLPNDVQQTWQLMKYGELEYPISKIIYDKLKSDKKYTLIDIGANVGLVSMYINNNNNNIENFICVEPVKNNFLCLKKNTKKLKNKNIYNFGLSNKNLIGDIFIDQSNHGNSSLSVSMMEFSKHKNYDTEKIEIRSVTSFFDLIKDQIKDKNLIIKIDAQLYDELIFSLIPKNVLNQTALLCYELTSSKNIKRPIFSEESFKKNLTYFNLIWSEELGKLSPNQLLDAMDNERLSNNIETDIYLMKQDTSK